VAPGVGKATDANIVFRRGVELLHPPWLQKLADEYETYVQAQTKFALEGIERLREFINDQENAPKLHPGIISEGGSGTERQGDISSADDASEKTEGGDS
jgi:hypothetical protein